MSLPTHFPIRAPGGKTIQIPSVGFGTWASGSILVALKAGYRHLDCAWAYGVNGDVGAAIKESGIPREELFITTKFWPHFAAPENIEICLDLCLKEMGLDYVDLWLAHWPFAIKPISREALLKAKSNNHGGKEGSFIPTWQAMQVLVRNGKARTIGVSNFSVSELADIISYENDIPISCNQVEVHPWLPNNELIAFSTERGILTTCFSPFAGQKSNGATLLKDEFVLKLAEKNGMDVGQLLQSWSVGRGTVPLGKSSTAARIKSNFNIQKLSEEDMEALNSLAIPDGKGRTVDFSKPFGIPLFQNSTV
ncbi:Aldo/keto reductase [Stipitochalara longipes BDJ]|nr:Aldo/keto reductase [Stipitochalara longipes BDJ]